MKGLKNAVFSFLEGGVICAVGVPGFYFALNCYEHHTNSHETRTEQVQEKVDGIASHTCIRVDTGTGDISVWRHSLFGHRYYFDKNGDGVIETANIDTGARRGRSQYDLSVRDKSLFSDEESVMFNNARADYTQQVERFALTDQLKH